MKEGRHACAKHPTKPSSPRPVPIEPPEGHHVTEHQGDLCLTEEQRGREVETRALLMWTSLTAGVVVSLRVSGTGDYVGTVESSTSDGLIIWVRDDLNERRIFHFHDCQSVRLVK